MGRSESLRVLPRATARGTVRKNRVFKGVIWGIILLIFSIILMGGVYSLTDNMGVDNIENRILFDKYIGLWGNLDMSTQAELKPISYPEFIICPIKLQKIDFIKNLIYNRQK